ncbi:MAG: hypothetical protein NTV00_02485 [Methylococcales bacterium]|nr:hypothetical protein [Methylococcales bacterium]
MSWRKKKRLNTDIERLLDEVSRTKEKRKQWLAQFLVTKHTIATEDAAALSEQFIAAEKSFLHYFVKQQLEQSTLVSFYAQLEVLLDQYVQLIPITPPQIIQAPAANILNLPVEKKLFLEIDDTAAVATESETETDEPDWNDAFAEANDTVTKNVPPQIIQAPAVEVPDLPVEEKLFLEIDDTTATDEPDWNDAFAETNNTVTDGAPNDTLLEIDEEKLAAAVDLDNDAEEDTFAESIDILAEDSPVEESKTEGTLVQTDEEDEESDWDLAFEESEDTPHS